MKFRVLSILLIVFAALIVCGCGDPIKTEEPETSNQIASRGKCVRGEQFLEKATYSESAQAYSEAIKAFSVSLVEDPTYSRANALIAISIAELSRCRGFLGQTIMGLKIDLQTAMDFANRAVRFNGTSGYAWSAQAIIAIRLSDFETAENSVKMAKKYGKGVWLSDIASGDYMFNTPCDNTRKKAKNVSKAVAHYKASVQFETTMGLGYTRLLDVFEELNDVDGIIEIAALLKGIGMSLPDVRAAKYRAAGIRLP